METVKHLLFRWRNRKPLRDLVLFRRLREGYDDATYRFKNVIAKVWMPDSKKTQEERLKALAKSGRVLQDLTDSTGWKEVLAAKEYYQSLADIRMRNIAVEDKQRFQASVEWAALEGFFKELYGRIRTGRQAEKALAGLQDKKSLDNHPTKEVGSF